MPPGRDHTGYRRRAAGIFLALLLEGLLVLLVLTLGSSIVQRDRDEPVAVVRFNAASAEAERPDPQQSQEETPRPAERAPPKAAEQAKTAAPVTEPKQPPPLPPLIKISPNQMASADITPPKQPGTAPRGNQAMMGPPDSGATASDTPRVSGAGPNGEPLYAAAWYREPYPDELRGYLSTASGPGWGLIACRTAPDFRVEDCVKVDEYPAGSNIARSALAAAWQFRVRPPRVGGQSKVGEWVRIRIDYGLRQQQRF